MQRIMVSLAALVWAGNALAAELGDDGLHKTDWMHDTFKDLREDLEEANSEGKRLLLMVEQRGCIYCTRMHEQIFPIEDIEAMLSDDYFVVQINLHGDTEVTDLDGEVLSEKDAARRWGVMFTPTLIFLPQEVPDEMAAHRAAVATMPGAFQYDTTRDLLTWVLEEGYLGDEDFQRYHGRMVREKGVKPAGAD